MKTVFSNKNPILFIVGPTAVGKTQLALDLAKKLDGEIISCDAMQVYKEINIASAKPSTKELKNIKHHCLNLVSVTEDFDVAKFRKFALDAIEAIHKKGKIPIVVGGSGMYMSVLLDGIFEQAAKNDALREKLERQIKKEGTAVLYERLKNLDPQAAVKIHVNDAKRIVRALEVMGTTQKPISHLQQKRQGLWGQYEIKIFGLERPRTQLYSRVEERIEQMFEHGLVEEIKKISKKTLSPTAKTLIGVPEVQGYLQEEYDLAQAKYLMKLHTRHYVKRQMTWFRRDKRIEWVQVKESTEELVEIIMKELAH